MIALAAAASQILFVHRWDGNKTTIIDTDTVQHPPLGNFRFPCVPFRINLLAVVG